MNVRQSLDEVRTRVAEIAGAAGRDPSGVLLVAVTKGVSAELVAEALSAGQSHFGENRTAEAAGKFEALGGAATWHFVGRLQRNKVKQITPFISTIHSVDSVPLAMEISKRANRDVQVLLEVNTSGEDTKAGVAPRELWKLIDGAAGLERVKVRGLMTMAPLVTDEEQSRPCFRLLRSLLSEANVRYPDLGIQHLSMGMSQDYRVAIEEGATMVRVGRAIFGPAMR